MKVVVLNDGETYGEAVGCMVVDIPTHVEDVDQYVKKHYDDPSSVPVMALVCYKHINGGSK